MEKKAADAMKSHGSAKSEDIRGNQEKKKRERRRLNQKLAHIRYKIMVMSGKGGVGKTMVTVNLAVAMAIRGYQVGILDGDIHGPNVPKMLGMENRHLTGGPGAIKPVEVFKGLKAVSMALVESDPDKAIIWRGPLKHAAIKQFLVDVNWGNLDFLFIDLPPGTGDEPLSVAHLIQDVNGAIIVTTPQDVALLDSRKAVNFSKQLSVPVLGIVENMSGLICPHCGGRIDLFKVGGGQKAAEELAVPFLGRIPIDPLVVEKCDSGHALMVDSVESAAKKAFMHLIQKLLDTLEHSRKEAAPPVH